MRVLYICNLTACNELSFTAACKYKTELTCKPIQAFVSAVEGPSAQGPGIFLSAALGKTHLKFQTSRPAIPHSFCKI